MFKEIPFSKIKTVPDYVFKKLREDKVILGIFVDGSTIKCVESYWYVNESDRNKYTESYIQMYIQYPEMRYFDEKPYVEIRGEENDRLSETELRGVFRYKPIAFINVANFNEDEHQHWYYSDDRENVWGPLEINLVKEFMRQHPEFKPMSEDDENKEEIMGFGFSSAIAEYIVDNAPGLFRDCNLYRWIDYLKVEIGDNFADDLNKSLESQNKELFLKYFNIENIESALGYRK